MKSIPISETDLLAPIKASSQFKSWLKSHATEQRAALVQTQRAEAFQAIADQARRTLADRATADPQQLVRASSDLAAAEREQQACLAEAAEIERLAILAGQYGEATVRFATDVLMRANSEQVEILSKEIAELAKRHGVEITSPDSLQLPPMRVYDRFRTGTIDDRISALWYMLQ